MADKLVELEKVLKALANRRRLAIVRYLLSRKNASVGEIAGHLRLSMAATSRHLRQLAHSDLVSTEQVSTVVNYSLSKDTSLIAALRPLL
ncbi:MAG: metalloregulator ArsR/SmtB family transcription factor [Patescibacteria group bacterium]